MTQRYILWYITLMNESTDYELVSRLYLLHEKESFITPERIELLRSIVRVGSISGGAKAISKSYKWAWDSIAQMNAHAGRELVQRSSGGKGGGGAKVTAFAEALISYYDDLERVHQSKIARYQERFNHAFETGAFSNDIASTLQGQVDAISCDEGVCELRIAYGTTMLHAKCKRTLGLSKGCEVAFMVESNQIIIAKEAVAISAQNLLVGQIIEIVQEAKNVYLDLLLETQEHLRVLITTNALEQFDLQVGEDCFAYFKTYHITILGEKN